MTFKEAYAALKKAGTAQNIKIYQRHGAKKPMFGVSFAELGRLKKKIKVDHELALKLWETRNMDARMLGLMVADASVLRLKDAESWLKEVDYYLHSNYLAALVAKTDFALKAFEKWSKSKHEYQKHCAYDVLATTLKNGVTVSKPKAKQVLGRIEKEIHRSPNRARSAMNNAVIAIGVYVPGMKTAAIQSARRIGPVMVDHGETSCKTPDAEAYINKSLAHRKRKRKRR